MFDLRIWNMHGPTVFSENSWENLPKLMNHYDRLNDPRSNAGSYRLFATINGVAFEMVPAPGREFPNSEDDVI